MKAMKSMNSQSLRLAVLIGIGSSVAFAQDKPSTIDGVKGVKQEAVANIKNVAPPTVIPVTPPPPQGVKQETVADIKNVAPPTAAPAPANAAQGMNKVDGVNAVDGVKAAGRDAVQPPPPPPTGSTAKAAGGAVGAVSSIRAVKGVQGIIAPKQLNLEAALAIKQDGGGTPAGGGAEKGGNGKAAAAALLNAPGGRTPVKPVPGADGRAALQEFEKQTAPGS